MKAKTMNILSLMIIYICFSTSMYAQRTMTILLNSQRVNAQFQDNQVVSIDKQITKELLDAIRFPVARDATYYKELNEILSGKYGNFYAEVVKSELMAISKGIIKEEPEKLSYTAIVDLPDTKVKFVSGTARLEGSSSEKLVNLVDQLRTLNINYIMLEGHKKSNSIDDYILTTNRVNACKDYLIFKGIEKSKIKTKILLSTSDANTSKIVKIVVK